MIRQKEKGKKRKQPLCCLFLFLPFFFSLFAWVPACLAAASTSVFSRILKLNG